jgi:peptide/nickel transport system substrate-binding protein
MSETEAKEREKAGELGREYPFDIAKAKAELAKSKVPSGFTAKVQYPSSAPELGLAMQAWAQTLKEIGVHLEVEQFGDTSFYTKQTNGEFEMQVSTGAWDYPDPLDLNLILCGCSIPPNGFNATRFNHPEVNQLFKESFADTNQKSRTDKLVKLVKIATEEVPNPALWVRSAVTALNSELGMSNLGPWSYNSDWMTDIGKVSGS